MGTEVTASTEAEAVFTLAAAVSTEADFRGRGFGFFGPYVYGDYPYYYRGDYEDGCSLATRRILTRYSWRSRRVEVCN